MRTFSRRRWLAACAALLTVAALPALADGESQGPPGSGIPWQQLSPEQQRVLGQFRGRWDRMPPQQQEALLRGAQRWESLSPEQRQRIEQRAEQWRNMTP